MGLNSHHLLLSGEAFPDLTGFFIQVYFSFECNGTEAAVCRSTALERWFLLRQYVHLGGDVTFILIIYPRLSRSSLYFYTHKKNKDTQNAIPDKEHMLRYVYAGLEDWISPEAWLITKSQIF